MLRIAISVSVAVKESGISVLFLDAHRVTIMLVPKTEFLCVCKDLKQ